jgi:hypothetical protein
VPVLVGASAGVNASSAGVMDHLACAVDPPLVCICQGTSFGQSVRVGARIPEDPKLQCSTTGVCPVALYTTSNTKDFAFDVKETIRDY